jgi:hypothetical protein
MAQYFDTFLKELSLLISREFGHCQAIIRVSAQRAKAFAQFFGEERRLFKRSGPDIIHPTRAHTKADARFTKLLHNLSSDVSRRACDQYCV